jgi:hypothetical protein
MEDGTGEEKHGELAIDKKKKKQHFCLLLVETLL